MNIGNYFHFYDCYMTERGDLLERAPESDS
jgi:hypothetical protein